MPPKSPGESFDNSWPSGLQLITFGEGCRALHVSRATAERLAQRSDDDFPRPVKIGGQRFFFRHQISTYLVRKAREVGVVTDCAAA